MPARVRSADRWVRMRNCEGRAISDAERPNPGDPPQTGFRLAPSAWGSASPCALSKIPPPATQKDHRNGTGSTIIPSVRTGASRFPGEDMPTWLLDWGERIARAGFPGERASLKTRVTGEDWGKWIILPSNITFRAWRTRLASPQIRAPSGPCAVGDAASCPPSRQLPLTRRTPAAFTRWRHEPFELPCVSRSRHPVPPSNSREDR